jgi:hypothetical protein
LFNSHVVLVELEERRVGLILGHRLSSPRKEFLVASHSPPPPFGHLLGSFKASLLSDPLDLHLKYFTDDLCVFITLEDLFL